MKHREWYFKDWEARPQLNAAGRPGTVYVYTGLYYLLPENVRRFKGCCYAAVLLYLAGTIFLNFFPSPGGLDTTVGSLCLLTIIPLLLFLMATAALVRAGRWMTYRRYHRIVFRFRAGGVVAFFVLLAQLTAELFFLFRKGTFREEAVYLIVLILLFALVTVCTFVILKMRFPTDDPVEKPALPPDE